MSVTDSDIISLSLRDPLQFATLFDRHFAGIHSYFVRRGVANTAAQDLACDVFCRAFEYRRRFAPGAGGAIGWLYGIARNVLSHHLRSLERNGRAMERAYLREAPFETQLDRVDDRLDALVHRGLIADALDQLREEDREAVLLVGVDGLSYEEAARALDIPVGTVRSRTSRARSILRSALAELGPARLEDAMTADEGSERQ